MKWSLLGEGARERSSPGGSFSGLRANLGQSLGQVPLPRIQSGTLALFARSPDCFLLVTDAYRLCTTKHRSQGSVLFQRSQPPKMRVSRQASLWGSGFIYLLGGGDPEEVPHQGRWLAPICFLFTEQTPASLWHLYFFMYLDSQFGTHIDFLYLNS